MDFAPDNENDLAGYVLDCAQSGSSLRIVGGGSKQSIGSPVKMDKIVSTTALNGVVHYDPGALSLVVKAGTPVYDINAALADAGQRLAFEPMDHRSLLRTQDTAPTIGGIVACGISGPRRIRAGACRDFLLGVRFVNGKGEVIKNGGQVMKNVTGYDLVKFLCGSYGTLGILTELSFKTAPIPDYEGTFILTGMDDWTAVQFMSKALGQPLDITGAAHISEDSKTCLRIEGPKGFVETRLRSLLGLLREFSDNTGVSVDEIFEADSRDFWVSVRDIKRYAAKSGDVWRISVKPTDGPLFMTDIREVLDVHNYYDWGGGLIWVLTPGDRIEEAGIIREKLGKYSGHATLIRANETTRAKVPVFQPEPVQLHKLAKHIRHQFDPTGILNAGLLE